jgi:hypothetical protein
MPTVSVRYADHSAVLMPCIARVASVGQGRPAWGQHRSERRLTTALNSPARRRGLEDHRVHHLSGHHACGASGLRRVAYRFSPRGAPVARFTGASGLGGTARAVSWQHLRCPQMWSRRGKSTSWASRSRAAAAGMATKAPTMPRRAPPSRTATTVTRAGTLTIRPKIRGTSR